MEALAALSSLQLISYMLWAGGSAVVPAPTGATARPLYLSNASISKRCVRQGDFNNGCKEPEMSPAASFLKTHGPLTSFAEMGGVGAAGAAMAAEREDGGDEPVRTSPQS